MGIRSALQRSGSTVQSDHGGAEEILVFAVIIVAVVGLFLGFVSFGIPAMLRDSHEESRRDQAVDSAARQAAGTTEPQAENPGSGKQAAAPPSYIMKPGRYRLKLVKAPSGAPGTGSPSWWYLRTSTVDVTQTRVIFHFLSVLEATYPYYCHYSQRRTIVFYNRDEVVDADDQCRHLPMNSELPYNKKRKKYTDWASFPINKGFTLTFNFWTEDAVYQLVPE